MPGFCSISHHGQCSQFSVQPWSVLKHEPQPSNSETKEPPTSGTDSVCVQLISTSYNKCTIKLAWDSQMSLHHLQSCSKQTEDTQLLPWCRYIQQLNFHSVTETLLKISCPSDIIKQAIFRLRQYQIYLSNKTMKSASLFFRHWYRQQAGHRQQLHC